MNISNNSEIALEIDGTAYLLYVTQISSMAKTKYCQNATSNMTVDLKGLVYRSPGYSYHYTGCLLTKLSSIPNFAHVPVTAEAEKVIYYFKLQKKKFSNFC